MSHCSRIKLGPVEPQLLQSASAGGVVWGRTPPPALRHKGPSSACTVSGWQKSEAYTCWRAAGENGSLDTNGSAVEGGLSLSFSCRGAEDWWVFFLIGVKIQRGKGCKNTGATTKNLPMITYTFPVTVTRMIAASSSSSPSFFFSSENRRRNLNFPPGYLKSWAYRYRMLSIGYTLMDVFIQHILNLLWCCLKRSGYLVSSS